MEMGWEERKGKRPLPVLNLVLILKMTLGSAIDRFLAYCNVECHWPNRSNSLS